MQTNMVEKITKEINMRRNFTYVEMFTKEIYIYSI